MLCASSWGTSWCAEDPGVSVISKGASVKPGHLHSKIVKLKPLPWDLIAWDVGRNPQASLAPDSALDLGKVCLCLRFRSVSMDIQSFSAAEW